MSFNYGLERKKFDAEWDRLRKEYAEAGMSKAAIEEMYQFDLAAFNRKRSDANHEQPLDGMQVNTEEVPEDRSPLLMRFSDKLSVTDVYAFSGRYSWIESINNEELYIRLLALSDDDKELLTLFAMEGFTKREIATIRGVSEQAVGQKISRLKFSLFGV